MLQNAGVALHRAKRGGGGREVFRRETAPHPLVRLGLETDLRRALEREELGLVYQPKVELSGGRVVAFEALTRWRHPGRAYSSLSYLRRFPLDVVKIDRVFVGDLSHGDGQAIVRALIDVSHALRATVLGEGIETTAQAVALRRMGCDLGQGFCFSPPLSPDAVERLLANGGSLLPAALRA